ncbi:MAG: hypothetical protein ABI234_17875 [Ktedonobacteraceae bacterium]
MSIFKRAGKAITTFVTELGSDKVQTFAAFREEHAEEEAEKQAQEEKKAMKQAQKQQYAQPHDTNANGEALTTSNMTQDQLRERRVRLIEGAKVARPIHEAIMLFALKVWLLLGPPAFVALTTSEIAYIFAQLLPPGDSGNKIILLGALFVDLAMMFTTFGVAIKRRDLAEKREVNGAVSKREAGEIWFGTSLWLVFATINVVGQSAFLLRIVDANASPGNLSLIYLFIGARVTGFILGDACTAFFLAKVDSSPLKLIARSEREKGILYADIANAEGKRQIAEAEAECAILLIKLDADQKKEDAAFLASLKRRAFAAALGDTPPPSDGPTRSRIYRGNT